MATIFDDILSKVRELYVRDLDVEEKEAIGKVEGEL